MLGGRGREGLVFKRPLSLSEDKLLVIISYTLRTQRKATTDISDTFGRQSSPLSFLEFLSVILRPLMTVTASTQAKNETIIWVVFDESDYTSITRS